MSPALLLLIKYKYIIIFPLAVIEGPIITVISCFLAAQGFLNIFILFFVFMLGDLVGDILYYSIGRYGGIKALRKWGHLIKLDETKLEKLSLNFQKHDVKILLIGKTQAIGSLILITAGISKMKIWRFAIINLLASLPKVLLFMFLGYYFGSAYNAINGYMQKIGIISTLILIVGLILYFIYKRKK